jgi:serine/threonine protein kinase
VNTRRHRYSGPQRVNRFRAEIRSLFGRRRPRAPQRSFPRTLSHYQLLKEIGEGSGGAVYLARDIRLGRLVAIKILRERLCGNRDSRRRFLREARCASAINHPNVVTIHDAGYEQGTDFLVMEYIQGRTLDQIIPKHGLPLDVCLDYALQMAKALEAVQGYKMIHRDLKPSNFAIARKGTVKLLDFGLAKLVRLRKTRNKNSQVPGTCEGTILGTVGYMSPEQVRGLTADQRTDIFSFGAIFYEMLTGRRAFQKDTAIETMHAILDKAPVTLARRIPPPIAMIVDRCLQKNPHRRYSTARKLVTALALANRHVQQNLA